MFYDPWMPSAPKKILIKNGIIVNSDSTFSRDIYIKEGIIAAIHDKIKEKTGKNILVIDANGMYVMPGGIDTNTNFDYTFRGQKTVDDFYYGTRAAVAGGTTTVIDCVRPNIGEPLETAYKEIKKRADSNVVCDYALRMGITWWGPDVEREMGKISITRGVNNFKVSMADKNTKLDDTEMYMMFNRCKKLGALPVVHAENGAVIEMNVKRLLSKGIRGPEGHYLSRPEELEVEAVNRVCTIAHQVECPIYISSMMSSSAVESLADKQKKGYKVYGETIAAALGSKGSSQECSFRALSAYITNPPINHRETNPLEMMNYLVNGVLLTTGSNNRTFYCDQKAKGIGNFIKIPDGVNGVEDRLSVVWQKGVMSNMLTLNEFVAVTSTNAAKLFNLYPQKGVIQVGSDADLVIWNPDRTRTLSHNNQQLSDFNIFAGMVVEGSPEYVIVKGKLCVNQGTINVSRGFGSYIYSHCFSPFIYPPPAQMQLENSSESEEEFSD